MRFGQCGLSSHSRARPFELVAIAREQGVLINVTADKVIRLVPPLIFGVAEADALVAAVTSYVTLFLTQAA